MNKIISLVLLISVFLILFAAFVPKYQFPVQGSAIYRCNTITGIVERNAFGKWEKLP